MDRNLHGRTNQHRLDVRIAIAFGVTEGGIVGVIGAYQSAVTQTASQTAERLGIPFVNAESSSPGLTDRSLKFFFRTGPHDDTFAKNLFMASQDSWSARAL